MERLCILTNPTCDMNCSNYCFIYHCCKEIDVFDYGVPIDVKCYCCKQFSTTITDPNPK